MTIKEILKDITKKEWKFLVIMSLVIIILTTIPYVYGYLNIPKSTVYTGIHGFGMGDNHVFYSYIEQVKDGDFIFKDLFTSEKQGKIILNIFWLSAGLFAKIFNFPTLFAFHLLRILLIPVFIIVLYVFNALIFFKISKRLISFIILLFSGGLGYFFAPFIDFFYKDNIGLGRQYNWPMDLWVPEAYTFLTFYHSPHFIASAILFISVFLFSFISLQKDNIRYSIISGVMGLFLFQFHPFHVPTIFGVLIVYILVKSFIKKRLLIWKYLKHLLIIAFISFPSILYYLILIKYDPITSQRAIQNVCLTPKLWIVIISYGLLFFCSLGSLYLFIKRKIKLRNIDLFIMVWLLVQFFLIFFPLNWQRRLTEGLHFPMTILTAVFLFYVYEKYLKNRNTVLKNKVLLIFIFIIFFASSCMVNIFRDIYFYNQKEVKTYPEVFYVSVDRIDAMKWMKKNTPKEAVILSEALNGNFIPGIATRKVFVGHGVETLFYEVKLKYIQWFFRENKNNGRRRSFLKNENIDYIFYSDFEKKLGNWKPENKDYLKKVYENEKVEIYKFLWL